MYIRICVISKFICVCIHYVYTFISRGLHTGYMHTCIYRYTDVYRTRVINKYVYIFNTHYAEALYPAVYRIAYNVYIINFKYTCMCTHT